MLGVVVQHPLEGAPPQVLHSLSSPPPRNRVKLFQFPAARQQVLQWSTPPRWGPGAGGKQLSFLGTPFLTSPFPARSAKAVTVTLINFLVTVGATFACAFLGSHYLFTETAAVSNAWLAGPQEGTPEPLWGRAACGGPH